ASFSVSQHDYPGGEVRVEPVVTWKAAMTAALYGQAGFFTRPDKDWSAEFRSSANSSAVFATALLRLVVATDEALGRPATLDVIDIGAGGGHLLRRLSLLAPAHLGDRLRLSALELAPRPADLPDHIGWLDRPPEHPING